MRWMAVWQRNLLVWWKLAGPAIIGNFGEPLLVLAALGHGLGGFVGEMQGMPYLHFLASGILCSSAMNTASFEGMYSAFTRMTAQKTWEAMLAAPLSVDDIILGEAVWAGTKALISALAILTVITLFGVTQGWQALWVLPILLLTGVCFGSLALIMTAFSRSYDFFLYYFTLIVTPMYLLSGVFFPLERMPEAVQTGARMLPLSHAVALVRPLVTGQPLNDVPLHLGVLAAYTMIALGLAIYWMRRRLSS